MATQKASTCQLALHLVELTHAGVPHHPQDYVPQENAITYNLPPIISRFAVSEFWGFFKEKKLSGFSVEIITLD